MIEPGDDPLWYDRAEPDPEPGWMIQAVAVCYVELSSVFALPGSAYEACERALARFQGLLLRRSE